MTLDRELLKAASTTNKPVASMLRKHQPGGINGLKPKHLLGHAARSLRAWENIYTPGSKRRMR